MGRAIRQSLFLQVIGILWSLWLQMGLLRKLLEWDVKGSL